MMRDIGAHEATPFAELERQMMDATVPKNEREWWSWREINNLRDTITTLRAENEKLRAELADAEREIELLHEDLAGENL